MRWTPGGRSSNIEDRRGTRSVGMPLGIGGTVIVLILSLVFGRNLFTDLGTTEQGGAAVTSNGALAPEDSAREEPEVQFVSFVLDDAQHTWARILQSEGLQYHDAKLVLFRDGTQSGCGPAQSAMGPFYCPLDEKVYIDLGFYDELRNRFGAPGDFAQAYVLAHELGHHVQHLLGTDAKVREAQERNADMANQLSVRLELQADCYAGVWGHSTAQRDILERGDVEEGLGAAAAVGDDRIQRRTTGRVNVDSFTHGSSEQRVGWFKRGFDTGQLDACDTFARRAR
jgi:predicted metalloprotease